MQPRFIKFARPARFLLLLTTLGAVTGIACIDRQSLMALQAAEAPGGPLIQSGAAALPVAIPANHAGLRFSGRWDREKPESPRCAWSAATVTIAFRGTDLNVQFDESGTDYWQVEIDGAPAGKIKLQKGPGLYRVASGLAPGAHVVRLVKATEAFVGVTSLLGFQLNQGAELTPAPTAAKRLEVIGDSISAGYGNEAASKEQHFAPETENAYFTYGAIAARQWGADYTCVAWSGRKMWPNNTIPELYDRTLPQTANSQWDFKSAVPDAVVINLATNDFGAENPDETGWTNAYIEFIARVRKHYPNAQIYCAIGPMMGDWNARKPLTTLKRYLQTVIDTTHAKGDKKVALIDFGVQTPENGYGADWHPNIKTQNIMAGILTERLKADFPKP